MQNPERIASHAELPHGDDRLTVMAELASGPGFDVVNLAGFLDGVDEKSKDQLRRLADVSAGVEDMLFANGEVRGAVEEVVETAKNTLDTVESSVDYVRQSGQQSNSVAGWVAALVERMGQVADALIRVESKNNDIADIARQVNILAINAKIEAARAGEHGLGFGVVAEAINELSQKTSRAAAEIEGSVTDLSSWVSKLSVEAGDVGKDASEIIDRSSETDRALVAIADGVRSTHDKSNHIQDNAARALKAMETFRPAFDSIAASVHDTAEGIHQARDKSQNLIDTSETMVQQSVELGGKSLDGRFIARVVEVAQRVSLAFEDAIDRGDITMEALFDTNYTPIPGTNPAQMTTRFTDLTDRHLPSIQEDAAAFDPSVVFCAAVDRNGYLPTHNKKFSQQQGADAEWNMANCRNRRIFDDRVGLKAGRNTQTFLLQVYRRDMGGGNFVLMKDLSAPIYIRGRHWGGLRLAYKT